MISTHDERKHESLEAKLPENTDVIFVGAGPIGLATAIGLKSLDPHLSIVMAERYEEYQRKHNLIMDPTHLEMFMKATGTEHIKILSDLLADLKKNPRIRTNKLEEALKKVAKQKDVEIIQHKVSKQDLEHLSESKEHSLIVGADGTHSAVSENLFPEDNQIKHEFDFVLQLRYDIVNEEKPQPLKSMAFFQQMARDGMIANEYVGKTENKVTPVTMQMMISKEEYKLLEQYTSKKPLKFDHKNIPKLPKRLSEFVGRYLVKTLQQKSVQLSDIKISVNEAPATHAKKLVHKTSTGAPALLVGDAALGLSYFKGLNAGFESLATLFTLTGPSLESGLKDNKEAFNNALLKYQQWFLNSFAPRKVKEVESYSTWRINAAWNLMRTLRFTKLSSRVEHDNDPKYLIADYLNRQATAAAGKKINWDPYPHRPYNPEISLWTLDFIPYEYSVKKTIKIFTDYFTPYKAFSFQFKRDLRQPLADLALMGIGVVKFFGGIIALQPKFIGDGTLSFIRGALSLVTLGWLIKPFTKIIATAVIGPHKIEENDGLQLLVKKGRLLLDSKENDFQILVQHPKNKDSLVLQETKEAKLSVENITRVKHICFDINRKFNNSLKKGQLTAVSEIKEIEQFNIMREGSVKSDFESYFSLFAKKPEINPSQDNRVTASVRKKTR